MAASTAITISAPTQRWNTRDSGGSVGCVVHTSAISDPRSGQIMSSSEMKMNVPKNAGESGLTEK
jgi:hypothetical protein